MVRNSAAMRDSAAVMMLVMPVTIFVKSGALHNMVGANYPSVVSLSVAVKETPPIVELTMVE